MLRVLLVDDEPFILRGMKELIDWEDEGFEIVGSAADGEEALLFLQNHDADLILSKRSKYSSKVFTSGYPAHSSTLV
jgi:two-component system, response regulator YesN